MRCSFIAVAATLVVATPAAATVRYDFFTSTSGSRFSLTRADFVRGPLFVDVADLDSCLVLSPGPVPCLGAEFTPADPSGADRLGLAYRPEGTLGGETFFYFPLGAFTRAGVYRDTGGFFEAELRVTDFKDGAVPEPASWALMITGFGLAGGTLRRSRRAAAVG